MTDSDDSIPPSSADPLSSDGLPETREALRAVLDNSHDAIFVHDLEGRVLDVNQKMCEMYGVTREEAYRFDIESFSSSLMSMDVVRQHWGAVVHGESRFFEWKARRPLDEHLFDVEVHLSRFTVDGRHHILANVRDITARKDAESERAQLVEQLYHAQRLEAVGRLAGGIAHDFNNILTGIMGYAELILEQSPEGGEVHSDAMEIINASSRATELTSQLLAFSRKQVIEPRVINLNLFLARFENMLQRVIGDDIRLDFKLDEGLWNIEADPAQVEQIVMNLAINARDAMPEGGVLGVETCCVNLDGPLVSGPDEAQTGSFVQLIVSDTGMGMSRETVAQIFEPFFSTKLVGKGTGLGLSTVYGIMQQNGGFIKVYSEPGFGSAFRLYFPRADRPTDDVNEEACLVRTPTVTPEDGCTETVLLVEDEDVVRTLAHRILTERGYTVLAATDGPSAIKLAAGHSGSIDLLLTDVVMPGMNGRELWEALRSTHGDLPLLMMSGYAESVIVHHGVLEPGRKLLSKPFSVTALTAAVRSVLDEALDSR